MPSDTYEAILWVSRRLFMQKGYASTSMSQIAGEVGIGKATIYHHFMDKQAILSALLDNISKALPTPQDSLGQGNGPHVRIRELVKKVVAFYRQNSDILQVISREAPDLKPQVTAVVERLNDFYSSGLVKEIQSGVEHGIFRPLEGPAVVRVLMAVVEGLSSNSQFPGHEEKELDVVLDIFFHGIDA